MRILTISALFPPEVIGGAEVSAWNIASELSKRGHDVSVLTTTASTDKISDREAVDGLRISRVYMPRPYPIFHHQQRKGWRKLVWHLQDHFDPRNRGIMADMLDADRPDVAIVHLLSGLGHNSIVELARRNIPVLYVLHDLGLACIRGNMFRMGKDCVGRCPECAASAAFKKAQLRKLPTLGFAAPSRANLDGVLDALGISNGITDVIINPNRYPLPTRAPTASDHIRFLYVGRLHKTKGVDVLASALEDIANRYRFSLTVVGSGPVEDELRGRFGGQPWCTFVGQATEQEVADYMVESDVLCVPSIWAEPLGMVMVRALSLGIPVIGSDRGGIPEVIRHEQNGLLVKAGDVEAWRDALKYTLDNSDRVEAWRRYAIVHKNDFEPGALMDRYEALLGQLVAAPSPG